MVSEIAAALAKGKEVVELAKKVIEKGDMPTLTPKIVEKAREGKAMLGTEENPFKVPRCINRKLEGNGLFEKKVFKVHGVWVEGVFPKFEGPKIVLGPEYNSKGFWEENTRLTKGGNKDSSPGYKKQMEAASKKMYKEINEKPELRKDYSEKDIQDLRDGKTPEGKVWHHFEELGPNGEPIMQLVDKAAHQKYKHTGGSYVWNEKHYIKKYGEEKYDAAQKYNTEIKSSISNFSEVYKGVDLKSDMPSSLEREKSTQEVVDKALSPEKRLDYQKETIEGRMGIMQDLFQQMLNASDLRDRPFRLDFKEMPGNCRGSYNEISGKITLNRDIVTQPENYVNGLRTLLHETRHALQDEARFNPNKYGISSEKALEWSNNFQRYIRPEFNLELYKNQSIERDARSWAEKFVPQNTKLV